MISRASGAGTRTAIPSAMVSIFCVLTGLPARHDMDIAGAPRAHTAMTLVDGENRFIHKPLPLITEPLPRGTMQASSGAATGPSSAPLGPAPSAIGPGSPPPPYEAP